ncbi:hypothetical protein [Urechidicola vernalis]|uniref:Beta-carotene 15,15'-monooxygenase n=1 Tax=Urechidicola vernalis TaxID=3075600 RepID=A0ABU2Y395_9FLAO|nr:hypothetical protein [Urechidicola sp. P050]MDT0552167.1 hypothetical protein [Urechidicola sp. P050]
MRWLINHKNSIIAIATPIFLIGLMMLITQSALFKSNTSALAIGVSTDLILVIPLIYYMLVRKTKIPNITVVPLLFLCIAIGSYIIPTEEQSLINIFKSWGLPLIEIFILFTVIKKIRKGILLFKTKKGTSPDFYNILKATCNELLPKGVSLVFVTEIAVFYYGFAKWTKRVLKQNEYSYHKKSGTISLLAGILLIIVIETIALHFLILKWSETAAWIVTFISIYTGLQIFGFMKSLSQRPYKIEKDALLLSYGIMNETRIEFNDIVVIDVTSKDLNENNLNRKLSFFGNLESHNVVLHLKSENTLISLYGIHRKFKTLAFFVDNPIEFEAQLNKAINGI